MIQFYSQCSHPHDVGQLTKRNTWRTSYKIALCSTLCAVDKTEGLDGHGAEKGIKDPVIFALQDESVEID